jgi:hypothetical protein
MCIYHNDTKLLQKLLNTYRYPKSIKGDFTPLSYAFEKNDMSMMKLLCEYLSQCEYRVDLTRRDFEYLLVSPYGYCDKVIITIPKPTKLDIFPKYLEMDTEVITFNSNSLKNTFFKIKEIESSSDNKKNNNNEVISYEVPFAYSFESGSTELIQFLNSFSKSNDEEYLLSQWKNVIFVKWKQQFPLQIMVAIIYWIYTGLVVTSMIFDRDHKEIKFIALTFMSFLFLFEYLQIVSYCFARNIKK